jgi:hypothetical protein
MPLFRDRFICPKDFLPPKAEIYNGDGAPENGSIHVIVTTIETIK